MKKIIYAAMAIPMAALLSTAYSCRMAPQDNPGDTVAAAVFEPREYEKSVATDTTTTDSVAEGPDSIDIFYVGDGSTADRLQLVSYPSQRDTAVYTKGQHIKVSGNADVGHAVRVRFWVTEKGDSLVTRAEEFLPSTDTLE